MDATKGFDYSRRTFLIIRHNSCVIDDVQKLGTADSSEDSLKSQKPVQNMEAYLPRNHSRCGR